MPKKGGKKKKGPVFYCSEADTAPFGFKAHDIIRTPLGLIGTVIGVKYDSLEDKSTGRLWVRYENGLEAPLEPKSDGTTAISNMGYNRSQEADHIRRDTAAQLMETKRMEEQRRIVEEIIRLKALGLPIPENLIPDTKKKGGGKKKGGKKDKK